MIRHMNTSLSFGGPRRRGRDYYGDLADWMDRVAWYDDRRVLDAVADLIPADAQSCLELCCGTGRLAVHLALHHRFVRYDAWDESIGMTEKARARCWNGGVAVNVAAGSWQVALRVSRKYDVIVVKNSLHLIAPLAASLRALRRVSSVDTVLVVVETISPSEPARVFIEKLTAALGIAPLKKNIFDETALLRTLEESGWERDSGLRQIEQSIDVCDWLNRKATDQKALLAARALFASASDEVASALQFSERSGGVPTQMLRLQLAGAFRLSF
jgi:ubiquinone/menaquinone biosynthesis C-methylase UbiE